MPSGLLSRLARVRVTVIYAVALIVVTTTLLKLGPDVRNRVIQDASTNLHNLSRGHVGTLVSSAFVVDAGPLYLWLPGLVCLLAVGELLWRGRRLVAAFALGHVGATLLVAGWLTAAVEFGWLPHSVTTATDVGMSYGAIGVLGALTPAIPPRVRLAWIGWWLAVVVATVAVGTDFADVGHAMALVLGMVVATRFGRPHRWTLVRTALLAVGGSFGYLVLVDDEASTNLTVIAGLAGASAGMILTLLFPPGRREPSGTTDAVVSPNPHGVDGT